MDEAKFVKKNDFLITISLVCLLMSFAVFLSWGLLVKLDSATMSSGQVVVESSRKSVAHLEGGIVSELFVHEGQIVKKGDPLIKISDVYFINRLRQSKLTYLNEKLKYARLLAEMNKKNKFTPADDINIFPDLKDEFYSLVLNQKSLFNNRVQSRYNELAIIDSRLNHAKSSVKSSLDVLEQKNKALSYLQSEIDMHSRLLKDGYTSKIKILELQRSEVLLNSDIIQVRDTLQSNRAEVNELTQQRLAIQSKNNLDVENEISETRNSLLALESDFQSINDRQKRTVIRSPSDGIVMGLKVNSQGDVVKAGDTLMEIVPNKDLLVVESLVSPSDIDSVNDGQDASVRLTAYNSRLTPMLTGKIVYIDADRSSVTSGENTITGYKIKVKLNDNSLGDDSKLKLYPGMPAEVYILTKQKRPIEYLLEPLTESLTRAFREN